MSCCEACRVSSAPRTMAALGCGSSGFGGFEQLAQLAPQIASIAASVATIKGAKGPKSQASADQLAASILPDVQARLAAQGISLPGGQPGQNIVAAGLLDAFGAANRPFVIGGAVLLGVLVLVKVMKR